MIWRPRSLIFRHLRHSPRLPAPPLQLSPAALRSTRKMSSDHGLPPFADVQTKYTAPHNPGFTYGQKVDATEDGKRWLEGEKQGWKDIDTSKEVPM